MTHKFEWHDLRGYAVAHFAKQAGYIPPKMNPDYHWLDDIEIEVRIHKIRQLWYVQRLDYIKTIVHFPTVCFGCVYRIDKMLNTDIGLLTMSSTLKDFDECELCGKLGIEAELPY